jgi:hypothetical protein
VTSSLQGLLFSAISIRIGMEEIDTTLLLFADDTSPISPENTAVLWFLVI